MSERQMNEFGDRRSSAAYAVGLGVLAAASPSPAMAVVWQAVPESPSVAEVADTIGPLRTYEASPFGVTTVRFSPDGAWIAWASLNGTVTVATVNELRRVVELDHGAEIYDIEFVGGRELASAGGDGRVVVWNLPTGEILFEHRVEIRSLDIERSPTGDLVVLDLAGNVLFLDVPAGSIRSRVKVAGFLSLGLSPDGKEFATGPPLRVWKTSDGSPVSSTRHFVGGDTRYSPDGRWMAGGLLTAGTVVLESADPDADEILESTVSRTVFQPGGRAEVGVGMPILGVAFSHDERWLAVGGGDMRVELREVTSGEISSAPEFVLAGVEATISSVDFSPDDTLVAAGTLDGTVLLWRVPDRARGG